MGLFGFGKKKEEQKPACACQCGCPTTEIDEKELENTTCSCSSDNGASIKVLGSGCVSCHTLLENTKEAVKNMGLSIDVEYVQDMAQIAGYGVMSVPALVVNDKVITTGKILKSSDVENLLKKIGF